MAALTISPMSLFDDITDLYTDEWVHRISKHCLANGYVAGIDYDPENQCWMFHTLYCPDGTVSKKRIASKFVQSTSAQIEARIENEICAHLEWNGHIVRRQVRCKAGIADIVTIDSIYEVKAVLDQRSIHQALGQVLLYRQCLGVRLMPFIAGPPSTHIHGLKRHLSNLGVAVLEWPTMEKWP